MKNKKTIKTIKNICKTKNFKNKLKKCKLNEFLCLVCLAFRSLGNVEWHRDSNKLFSRDSWSSFPSLLLRSQGKRESSNGIYT